MPGRRCCWFSNYAADVRKRPDGDVLSSRRERSERNFVNALSIGPEVPGPGFAVSVLFNTSWTVMVNLPTTPTTRASMV